MQMTNRATRENTRMKKGVEGTLRQLFQACAIQYLNWKHYWKYLNWKHHVLSLDVVPQL